MTMKFNFDGRHAINSSNVYYISPSAKTKWWQFSFFRETCFRNLQIDGLLFIPVSKASQKRQM